MFRFQLLHERRVAEGTFSSDVQEELRDRLRRAVRAANVQPITGAHSEDVLQGMSLDRPLTDAYRREVDDQLRTRLQTDADFSARQFPVAKRYFRPS